MRAIILLLLILVLFPLSVFARGIYGSVVLDTVGVRRPIGEVAKVVILKEREEENPEGEVSSQLDSIKAAKTDRNGMYSLLVESPGKYRLRVDYNDHQTNMIDVYLYQEPVLGNLVLKYANGTYILWRE